MKHSLRGNAKSLSIKMIRDLASKRVDYIRRDISVTEKIAMISRRTDYDRCDFL